MLGYPLLAALLYSISFKPIGIWIAAPIAIAIQIYSLRKYSYKVLQSFIFAFLSGLIILSWSKSFVGALPWILLALLQGLMAIPIGLVAKYTKALPPIFFAILAMEEVRARTPFGGFSWTRITFSQVDSPFAPIISIGGAIGLSLVTLFIAQLFLQRRALQLVSLMLLAIISQFILPSTAGDQTLNIRAIQGGVPERGLDFNARAQAVLDNHIKVTVAEISSDDELVLWPENAIDISPLQNKQVAAKLKELSKEIDRPLIAGAILDEQKLYNATILFDSSGEVKSIYRKRYLTPFGEYIPLRSLAGKVSPHVDRVTDFSPGNVLTIHRSNGVRVGSVICYELLNDGIVREAAQSSQLLVVHTNSATFSGSSEGEQQLAITRLRAIESGRSIVSISTTGPSALINERGVVFDKLADGEVGSLADSMTLSESKTLSHQLGGLAPLFVLLFTLMWAVISIRRSRL